MVMISGSALEIARDELHTKGATCVRGVFDPRWIDLVRDGLDETLAEPSRFAKTWTEQGGEGRFFQDGYAWNRFEPLRQFIFESPAGRLCAELMRSSHVNIYMDHVLVREPNTDKSTPWHHDTPYCFVEGADFCTIWLPVDPIAHGEGIEVVAGSHRWGKLFFPVDFSSTQNYAHDPALAHLQCETVPDIDAARDKHEILTWDVGVGDCVVFWCHALHGAPPHRRAGRRRVYSTRWVGDDARYVLRPWPVPSLLHDPGLRPGDPIGGPLFPRIYPGERG
jgi:ectoine hydroxylase-related dioxygenase (phytanoyl-CoA dioxygenase family)